MICDICKVKINDESVVMPSPENAYLCHDCIVDVLKSREAHKKKVKKAERKQKRKKKRFKRIKKLLRR